MSMELRCGSNIIAINCPLRRSHNHSLTRIFSVFFRFCCSLLLAAVCDRVQSDKQPALDCRRAFLPRRILNLSRIRPPKLTGRDRTSCVDICPAMTVTSPGGLTQKHAVSAQSGKRTVEPAFAPHEDVIRRRGAHGCRPCCWFNRR
jgi:hypothetical protein